MEGRKGGRASRWMGGCSGWLSGRGRRGDVEEERQGAYVSKERRKGWSGRLEAEGVGLSRRG